MSPWRGSVRPQTAGSEDPSKFRGDVTGIWRIAVREMNHTLPKTAPNDFPVTFGADTALLTGFASDWLKPTAHAFLGHSILLDGVGTGLSLPPSRRANWKLIFVPKPSIVPMEERTTLEWTTKLLLHHMLLNGIVVFVEFVDSHEALASAFQSAAQMHTDNLVIPAGCSMTADKMHSGKQAKMDIVRAADGHRIQVGELYDFLYERARSRIRLYYSRDSFASDRQPPNWNSVRSFLWQLQGGRCPCGQHDGPLPLADMHADHVIPRKEGGTHVLTNLQMAHARWNLAKGATYSDSARRLIREKLWSCFGDGWFPPAYIDLLCDPCLDTARVDERMRKYRKLVQQLMNSEF